MNTTTNGNTNGNPTRTPWKRIWGLSLVIQVVVLTLFWTVEPLRKNTMVFDPNAMEQQGREAEARSKVRREEERERREKQRIPEVSARELEAREAERRKRDLRPKLEELRRLETELKREREAVLEEFAQRGQEEVNLRHTQRLFQLAQEVFRHAEILRQRCPMAVGTEIEALARDLRAQTERYLDELSQPGQTRLRELSDSIARRLSEERSVVAALPADRRGSYGLFPHDADALRLRLDTYVERLNSLVFDEEVLAEMNQTDASPPPADRPSPELDEMDLGQMSQEIAERTQAMFEMFTAMRAAEIARLENTSFAEAFGSVIPESSAPAGGQTPPGGSEGAAPSNGTGGQAPSGGQAGGAAPQTVGELNAMREVMNQQVTQATREWSRARTIATQAGLMSGEGEAGSARNASAFQGSSAGGGRSASDGGGQGGDGQEGGGQLTAGDEARNHRAASRRLARVPPELIKARALPGRRFLADSERRGWLFIDSWYMIGPWENEGELRYDQVHPPEVMMDLEAEYSNGKLRRNGTRYPLRWQFVQSDTMRIVPPQEDTNSTYYAYTEVWVDRDRDLMLAIASDDAARVWVNDLLVWEDTGLSGWALDEGFRRVRFQEGYNRLLVRLENGIAICEFSVLLCPPDEVSGQGL